MELLPAALLTQGHVLIENVLGLGKTTLAKALARSLGLTFQCIRFTPDLLPSDIIGVNVFNQKTSRFEFRPGPLMAGIFRGYILKLVSAAGGHAAIALGASPRRSRLRGTAVADILSALVERVPVPVEESWSELTP